MKNKSGFSLLEILVVMAILGILAVAGIGTYFSSVGRSRDGRRKADLSTIQKALESYYNDSGNYPADINQSTLCDPVDPVKCYISVVPTDPKGTPYTYSTDAAGTYFKLYATLERNDDTGGNVVCTGTPVVCTFGVSSTNTTP